MIETQPNTAAEVPTIIREFAAEITVFAHRKDFPHRKIRGVSQTAMGFPMGGL